MNRPKFLRQPKTFAIELCSYYLCALFKSFGGTSTIDYFVKVCCAMKVKSTLRLFKIQNSSFYD